MADSARKIRDRTLAASNRICLPTGEKRCPGCQTVKDYVEFVVLFASVNGRQSRCRLCIKGANDEKREALRAYSKRHYENNRKKITDERRVARALNLQYHRERGKKYRTLFPEKHRLSVANAYFKNVEKYKISRKRWELVNRDKVCAKTKRWRDRHPEAARLQTTNYFSSRAASVPKWADFEKIRKVYLEAAALNKRDGRGVWHVDHIVPLRSKWVCGLHCPENLQIIPASTNCRKSNIVWPLMFERA